MMVVEHGPSRRVEPEVEKLFVEVARVSLKLNQLVEFWLFVDVWLRLGFVFSENGQKTFIIKLDLTLHCLRCLCFLYSLNFFLYFLSLIFFFDFGLLDNLVLNFEFFNIWVDIAKHIVVKVYSWLEVGCDSWNLLVELIHWITNY